MALIRALAEPAIARAPAVLGVDEFASRRGHSYGNLLVDVQTGRLADVLYERSAGSFAALARRRHQVVCRDDRPPARSPRRVAEPAARSMEQCQFGCPVNTGTAQL
jgi:transposase